MRLFAAAVLLALGTSLASGQQILDLNNSLVGSSATANNGEGRTIYSNNNVNLGNLDAVKAAAGGPRRDDEPKLTGPNVCTKQEP